MENKLLISDVMLKERTPIHDNTDPKLLYPTIKTVQDMYILPILGSALYNKLQTLIAADATGATWPAAYKTLLDIYIVDALIWYVLYELPTDLSYQFWNRGVMRKAGLDTDMPTMSDLLDIGNRNKNKAEFYAGRLKAYLRQTATSTVLPEYINPGNGVDTITPEQKNYTIPIYLGGDDCCCDVPTKPYGQ